MKKIYALSGSTFDHSINTHVLRYIQRHYSDKFNIELDDMQNIPLFKEGAPEPDKIHHMAQKIREADLVFFCTPEAQHSVPAGLKSALEWLSNAAHPFQDKRVAIISSSVMPQGGVRAQNRLKVILTAGGFQCHMFDAAEFMVECEQRTFDDDGNFKNPTKAKLLDNYMTQLGKWLDLFNN
ncbi:MAG: NADPH-dependent FMN reductase [Lactobacillus sp.]|jgi:NAD(P)H-dependent FMN reductase